MNELLQPVLRTKIRAVEYQEYQPRIGMVYHVSLPRD